jgi:hypothetical protein
MSKSTITMVICAALFVMGFDKAPASAMSVSTLAALAGEYSAEVQRISSDCSSYWCERQSNVYGGGYSVPIYGYTYGPGNSLAYLTAPVLGCPILSLDGFWRKGTRKTPIAIIKANRILIR